MPRLPGLRIGASAPLRWALAPLPRALPGRGEVRYDEFVDLMSLRTDIAFDNVVCGERAAMGRAGAYNWRLRSRRRPRIFAANAKAPPVDAAPCPAAPTEQGIQVVSDAATIVTDPEASHGLDRSSRSANQNEPDRSAVARLGSPVKKCRHFARRVDCSRDRGAVFAQDAQSTLIVAGPRTPKSLDQEYPPTEAVQRRAEISTNRCCAMRLKTGEDSVVYEDFNKIEGDLAESWEVSADKKSIVFHLRKGVKSSAGNELTADDVMWTFQRGWALKANFHWYMSQVLNVASPDDAFKKIDDYTVQVNIPYSSPLIDRLWTNIGLGILDAEELKKHVTGDDPWGSSGSRRIQRPYGPYFVKSDNYTPGQQIVYEASPNFYRGPARLKRIIFRELPTSANRVAALQAGSVDAAEFLQPRELALLEKDSKLTVWKVYGNYVHRVEMNMTSAPFTDPRVRQALNYLVPRDQIIKAVYFDTARITKSPISEIYPGYTDTFFPYGGSADIDKAKALLAEAGLTTGFKTELGYRAGDEIEEEIAVILKSAFAKASVDLQLDKLPASALVERYTKGDIPMWFFEDMAIVPDSAYVANLWLNSASVTDYPHFKDAEVDGLINADLKSTDEAQRVSNSHRVQEIFLKAAAMGISYEPGLSARHAQDGEGLLLVHAQQ